MNLSILISPIYLIDIPLATPTNPYHYYFNSFYSFTLMDCHSLLHIVRFPILGWPNSWLALYFLSSCFIFPILASFFLFLENESKMQLIQVFFLLIVLDHMTFYSFALILVMVLSVLWFTFACFLCSILRQQFLFDLK